MLRLLRAFDGLTAKQGVFSNLGRSGEPSKVPLTFEVRTTVDASSAGGAKRTPLTAIYSFDPDLSNGSGPTGIVPGLVNSYGPITMTLHVGDDMVRVGGVGTGIDIFSSAGSYAYEVRGSDTGNFSGRVLGYAVDFFRCVLIGDHGSMFGEVSLSGLSLFASLADRMALEIHLVDPLSVTAAPLVLAVHRDKHTPFAVRQLGASPTLALRRTACSPHLV